MPATPNRRRGDSDESEAHVHRRATDDDAVLQLHTRVDDHERRLDGHDHLIRGFAESIAALNETMGRIANVLELLRDMRGFWSVIKMISTFSRVVLGICALIAAAWGAFKFLVWLAGVAP